MEDKRRLERIANIDANGEVTQVTPDDILKLIDNYRRINVSVITENKSSGWLGRRPVRQARPGEWRWWD